MPKKLNDNLLARLYLGVARDYQQMAGEGFSIFEIREELSYQLNYELWISGSPLTRLDYTEKLKAGNVLDTFLDACPLTQRLTPQVYNDLYSYPTVSASFFTILLTKHQGYYEDSETPFTRLKLGSLMDPTHTYEGNYRKQPKQKKSNAFAYFVLLTVSLIYFTATLVAFYYMISEFIDSVERFVYNEGWFQAGLSIAGLLAGAAVGTLFGLYLAAMPIIMFGIMAGLANPIGLAIAATVCLAIIGAALFCGLANWVQPDNKKALDPKDPHRFALTDSEVRDLEDKGLDPLKVRCAIAALRQEMGQEEVPSLLNRLFTKSGGEKQALLKQVRQLRRGELNPDENFVVGNLAFDLKLKRNNTTTLSMNEDLSDLNSSERFCM
jgi:hypothetical protein